MNPRNRIPIVDTPVSSWPFISLEISGMSSAPRVMGWPRATILCESLSVTKGMIAEGDGGFDVVVVAAGWWFSVPYAVLANSATVVTV